MRIGSAVIAGLLIGAVSICEGQAITLRSTDDDTVVFENEERRPLLAPFRCDDQQNVYFRRYDPSSTSSPVIKLKRDKKSVEFSSSAQPRPRLYSISDFAISESETVYELIQSGNDVYIERFSADGSSSTRTKLDRQFWAVHVTVLGEGRGFLVSGADLPSDRERPPKLFTGLFDSAGRLLKPIRLDGDSFEYSLETKNVSASEFLSSEESLPLVNGNIETDSRGNIYLLRTTSPSKVFVLDPTGTPIRTLTATTTQPNSIVATMHVADGSVALLYQSTDKDGNISQRQIRVLDGLTGAAKYRYELSDNLGAAFACFKDQTFTFLTVRHGKLTLQTARPE